MDVVESLERNAIDASYQFTSAQGLSVAAMFSGFDNDPDEIIDPRYG